MKQVWFDKYRPEKIDGYVFKNNGLKNQINAWIEAENIPHLLFSGPAGTGKTTLAKVIINELGIDNADVLEINASSDNSVDNIRDRITNFVSTMSFGGDMRYVILDECDFLTPNAQAALRGVMEKYITTSRFIMTCNYPHKIIPAIHSRVQTITIDTLDKTEFATRMVEILLEEKVQFDPDTLQVFIDTYYPDMRKCTNELQANSTSGTLLQPEQNSGSEDYKLEMVALFRNKQFEAARKVICKQAQPEEYDNIFRFLYDNVEFWSDGDKMKEYQAIIIIRNGLCNHPLAGDPEINLSAVLCELENIHEGV